MDRSAVQQLALLEGVFQRRLSEAAFNMIYAGQSAVRLDGNEVAREADQVLIRDAVNTCKIRRVRSSEKRLRVYLRR
jgi:hypothetical protein